MCTIDTALTDQKYADWKLANNLNDPTIYPEDPATEVDISDLLTVDYFIRTDSACITSNQSDDTGQSFSKIKLNKIMDVTG